MPNNDAPQNADMAESLMQAYGESWYAATMVDAPPRPPLAVDLDVDVCVIGGGLAGLTVAREVARSGWSVALVEAGRLAQSASGRNTGFVLPGFGADADKIIARIGFAQTRDLWSLSQAGLDYVRNMARSGTATGVEPRSGWLYVSKTDSEENFADYIALLTQFGCEVEAWGTERVRSVLRSERYFNAIHYPQAIAIHPLNYALMLAAAAERDGARIFEHTPALSIDPSGVRKRIVTPAARLRASHVVLCGNVQVGTLMSRLAATLVPVTTYVITTAALGEKLAEAVGFVGGVSDTDLADNHYRVVGGDRLMLSGRSTVWRGSPRRYVGALTADIKRTYPQLGDIAVDYAWSGTLGITLHRMPQIGELGPGVWLASGFGGHGLNTTAMAGNIVARAIVAGDQTWRQFTPFELVWAGGAAGKVAAQTRVWLKRLRDRIAERRAKARELAHRNAAESALAAAPADAAEPEAIEAAVTEAAASATITEPQQDTIAPAQAAAVDGADPVSLPTAPLADPKAAVEAQAAEKLAIVPGDAPFQQNGAGGKPKRRKRRQNRKTPANSSARPAVREDLKT